MTRRFLTPLSIDHIDFNTGTTSSADVGRLFWNNEEGTLDLGMNNEEIQAVGMNFYMPPTKNNSGVVIPKGSFVMATGVLGDRITIAKAVTDGTISPEYMIGVASKEIAIGSETGLIVTNGTVYKLNTNAYTIGDILYPNPAVAGGLTNSKPTAPNIRTPIAIVLRKQTDSGRIYVRMVNGSVLGGTDSNVKFGTLANGDTLVYDSTEEVWKNQQPASGGGMDAFFLGGM